MFVKTMFHISSDELCLSGHFCRGKNEELIELSVMKFCFWAVLWRAQRNWSLFERSVNWSFGKEKVLFESSTLAFAAKATLRNRHPAASFWMHVFGFLISWGETASNRGKPGEGLVSAQQVCDSSVGARFNEKAPFMVWRQGLRCNFVHGTLCRNFLTLAQHRCFSTANTTIWLCAHIQYSVRVLELESMCSSTILRYLILYTVGSNSVFSCHWEWQCQPVGGLVCPRNRSKLKCPSSYDYILYT